MDLRNHSLLKQQAETVAQLAATAPRNPTLTERLEDQVAHYKVQLAKAEEALSALKANPEIERVMNLLQQV
jgi:hypothetical protein